MNKDQLMGEWNELKGRMKLAYAELTDDDYARAEGSREKLLGIIEQRFGDTKDKVMKKINDLHVPTN